jgi:hypothetical protein
MRKLFFFFAGMFIISSAALANTAKQAEDSTKYTEYYGKYKFEAGSPIDEAEVLWKDGMLTLSTAMGDATLTWKGVDSFLMSYMDGILTFKRDGDKKVKALHISVSGTELDGAKDGAAAGGATAYADLLGKYKFEAGSPVDEVEIAMKDGGLIISSSQGDATMTMLGTDSFSMSYMDGIITFKRGDDKKVKTIHIDISGNVLVGTKEAAAGTSFRREDVMDERRAVAVR